MTESRKSDPKSGDISIDARNVAQKLAKLHAAAAAQEPAAPSLKAPKGPTPDVVGVLDVDPKRVRAWKHHDRTATWYTPERCKDLIDSIGGIEQQEPAVARRIQGEANFDYELIYGMRRRFACETLGRMLKIRIVEADDARAAVLMHAENTARQDITPMERALSFRQILDGGVFKTQEALAEAMGFSKSRVTKMVKAAQIVTDESFASLFHNRADVAIDGAYKLSVLMEKRETREIVQQAARNLARNEVSRSSAEVLRILLDSPNRSGKVATFEREYPVTKSLRVKVTRSAGGQVIWKFSGNVHAVFVDVVMKAVGQILRDLG